MAEKHKHFACKTDEVAIGNPRKVSINGRDYGIYQLEDGYYGLFDRCPHRGGSICGGPVTGTAMFVDIKKDGPSYVYGKENQLVRCSWHGWEFDIKTGQCLADERLKARHVPISCEDDSIYLMLNK